MNTQTVLLPHKHVRFCDSLLGLTGFVRTLLDEPRSLDELWALLDRDNSGWLVRPDFIHLVLAVNILFALKQVELTSGNRLRRIST